VSPRSADFLREAQGRLDDARYALDDDRRATAVSTAYYATLYAARAALSEVDERARTHRGTWARFHERYVSTGTVDPALHRAAAAQQREREEADYDAISVSREAAETAVDVATRFVTAVGDLLG